MTLRATRFPWDAEPVLQTIPGNWIADDSTCRRIPPPPSWGGRGGDGGGDGPGGGPGDSGGPGGGTCGGPGDTGGPGDDACGGDGGGGGGGGGCFLTTAIVEKQGTEADDGPTLTALRRFRDTYMMAPAERRKLVADYYAAAPALVAAIPDDYPDWDWIGERIDAAVAAIRGRDDDGAFAIYLDMMKRLTARWLEPAGMHDSKATEGPR